MITKFMQEINDKIYTLNEILQDENYFKDLENKIEIINKMLKEKDKEIDRLNNIIDELEKSLKEEYDYCDKHLDPAFGTGMGVATRMLDRLKELKEGK